MGRLLHHKTVKIMNFPNTRLLLLSVILCFQSLITPGAFAGSITGTVTNTSGTPLQNIGVELFRWFSAHESWFWAGTSFTNASGVYNFSNVSDGEYRVAFARGSNDYSSQVYDVFSGEPYDGGTTIQVLGDVQISGIDAALALSGAIKGTVTNLDDAPLEEISVSAFRWNGEFWSQVAWTETDASGNYEFTGLNTGEYRVRFSDFSDEYIGVTYPNFFGWPYNGGQTIWVNPGTTVANINAQLSRGGSISGVVRSLSNNQVLQDVSVNVYQQVGGNWTYAGFAGTNASGEYLVSGLSPGTYRVMFNHSQHIQEVYDGKVGEWIGNAGTSVEVLAGQTTTGINAWLQQFARITGTVTESDGVTPIPNVVVLALDDWRTALTNDQGFFSIQLPPGEYKLVANPFGWAANSDWLGKVFGGGISPQHGGWWAEEDLGGTKLTLVSGQVVPNIHFALQKGAKVHGEITSGNLPLADARALLIHEDTGLTRWSDVDETGAYDFRGLLPGTYTLKAESDQYAAQWWKEAFARASATPIALNLGEVRRKDFDLSPGQSPAYVEVKSNPPGAAIYLDYHPTGEVTPAIINVGEVASFDTGGFVVASHVVSLRTPGQPRPAPRVVFVGQAETASLDFELTSTESGSLSISTIPAGADVFVNFADSPEGVTPMVLNQLAPGNHTILLRKAGYLRPRPVVATVAHQQVTQVVVPLQSTAGSPGLQVAVESDPTGLPLYVNYLPTGQFTNGNASGLDPQSHSGENWYTTQHTVLVKADGFPPMAPRFVPDDGAVPGAMQFDLSILDFLSSPSFAGAFDGGDNRKYIEWFGWYNDKHWPWVWDYQFGGWLWVVDNGPDNLWFWHHNLQNWMWTRTDWYGWVWFPGNPGLSWRSE